MGEVIRKTNRAGRFIGYYIRFVDADGKRKARATKATSAAEARRILVALEATAGRCRLGIPERPQPITGVEVIGRWLDEAQPRTTNREAWVMSKRHALARALPYLDAVITQQDAVRIVRKLSAQFAPGTVRVKIVTLKSAWAWASSTGIVSTNPWSMRPPAVDKPVEYLSRDEVTRLLAAVDADRQEVLAVAVRLAVYTGLRVCEVYGLRWRSVDFDRNVITIRSGYRDSPTKSRRERTVPIADQLREVLLNWRQRCPSLQYVCPSTKGTAKSKRPDIRRLYRSAGLSVPRAPWHVLRHTFASHFLMSGGGLLTLQRLLGHTSVAITQIYSHLSHDHVAAEMKRLKL